MKIVETGSMRAAGAALGISKSVVSHEVNRLEERLGARLLNRNTRRLVPTEAGARFITRGRSLLNDWHEVEREVAEYHARPKGLLRVTAPPAFGALHLAPALVDFQERYPDIAVDLNCGKSFADMFEHGFDVAIRITVLADTQLVQRRLVENRLMLVASPRYLADHGRPLAPADLEHHRCLRQDKEWAYWSQWLASLPEDERPRSLEPSMTLDTSLALKEAAIAGGGIALIHSYLIADAVASGRLALIMPDRALAHGSIHALVPHSRRLASKTRCLIDFLVQRFSRRPPWDEAIAAAHRDDAPPCSLLPVLTGRRCPGGADETSVCAVKFGSQTQLNHQ
jgi:DNA-binding transcriptional LysR family regulator